MERIKHKPEDLDQITFVQDEIYALPTNIQELAHRLVLLNNRAIVSYKTEERLYSKLGKTSETDMSNAKSNRWIALHPAQTISDFRGEPWEAYREALEHMIIESSDKASIRKQYADTIAGAYIDAKVSQRKENEKVDTAEKSLSEISKTADDKKCLNEKISGLESEKKTAKNDLTAAKSTLNALLRKKDELNAERERKEAEGEDAQAVTSSLIPLSKEIKELEKSIKEKESNTQEKEGKLKELKTEKTELETKIEKLKKERAEKTVKENARQKELGKTPNEQHEMLDDAIEKYLDAIEMTVVSPDKKEEEIKAITEKLQSYAYKDSWSFEKLITSIDTRLEKIRFTQTDRKKRKELEDEFKNLKLKLTDHFVGFDIMKKKLIEAQGKTSVIENVEFTNMELFTYVVTKLRIENKPTELAKLLLNVFMNKKLDYNLRVTAMRDFVDLIYEKLSLDKEKELPEFDSALRSVLKDIFRLSRMSELQDPKRELLNAIKTDENKNEINQLMDSFETLYKTLKERHINKKQDSWHEMQNEEKKLFLADEKKIVSATDKEIAKDEINQYEFFERESQQLLDEIDISIWQNHIEDYLKESDLDKNWKVEQLLNALEYGKEAIELDPDNAETHRKLAEIHFALKDFENALSESKKAIEKDPYDFKAHQILIDAHRKQYQPTELHKAYMALAKAHTKKAEEEKEKDNQNKAIEQLEKARQAVTNAEIIMPLKAETLALKVEIYEQLGGLDNIILPELDSALQWLKFSKLRKFLSFRRKKRTPDALDTVEQRLRRVRSKLLTENNQFIKALPDLAKCEKLGDNSKEIYTDLARSYRQKYYRDIEISRFLPFGILTALALLIVNIKKLVLANLLPFDGKFIRPVANIMVKYMPYTTTLLGILGIILAGCIMGHFLYKYMLFMPQDDKNKAIDYFRKAIKADPQDIALYEEALDFARELKDNETVIMFADQAVRDINLNEIIGSDKRDDTQKRQETIKIELIEALTVRIKNKLTYRPGTVLHKLRSSYMPPSILLPELRGILSEIESAKAYTNNLTDESSRNRLLAPLDELNIKLNAKIVRENRWDKAPFSILRAKYRYPARFELAKALVEYAKSLPDDTKKEASLNEAISIMELLRNRENAPDVAKTLSTAYVLLAEMAIIPQERQEYCYEKAIALDPINGKAYFGRALLYDNSYVYKKREIIDDLEKALTGEGLEDDTAITTRKKLIEIYEGSTPNVQNPLKTTEHRKKLNDLETKKDPKTEKYRPLKTIKRTEALKRNVLLKMSEKAEKIERLRAKYDRQEKLLAKYANMPQKKYIRNVISKEHVALNTKIRELDNEITNLAGAIPNTPDENFRLVYMLKDELPDTVKPEHRIALLNWLINQKSRLLGNYQNSTKLILAELLVGKDVTETPKTRINNARETLKKLEEEKREISELESKNLIETKLERSIQLKAGELSNYEMIKLYLLLAKISTTTGDTEGIQRGFRYLRQAVTLMDDSRYADKIVELFSSLTEKLIELEKTNVRVPSEMRSLLEENNFIAIISLSPEHIKKVATTILTKEFELNGLDFTSAQNIINERAFASNVLTSEDKAEILKLLTSQINAGFFN
ncbi:MAG: hypothetical protein KJ864_06835, partial [Candidatus Omnitrophica bacterium]|nr:hypothetical protein [Candidatus Omnitrophota bacterium]